MFRRFMNKRRYKRREEFQRWFDTLDDESQQETAVNYLRKLDNSSLKRLYAAVELYRKGDAELNKVKDPEPEVEEDDSGMDESGYIKSKISEG